MPPQARSRRLRKSPTRRRLPLGTARTKKSSLASSNSRTRMQKPARHYRSSRSTKELNKEENTVAQTKTVEHTATIAQPLESKGEVAYFKPPRLPYHEYIEERFDVDRIAWKALVEAIFPAARTVDAVAMALA